MTQEKQWQEDREQVIPSGFRVTPNSVQKEVFFKTEDGWTIHGTFTLPATCKDLTNPNKLPAALLLHGSTHSQTAWRIYPGWQKIEEAIATLRIDLRGCGKSREPIPFVRLSRSQRRNVVLDVKAALEFLCSQEQIDTTRIAVVAEEFSAGPAVKATMEDARVHVFILLSGLLDEEAIEFIEANATKPILFIVSKEDKRSFEGTTRAYNSSRSAESELWAQDGLGSGLTMNSAWRNKYSDRKVEGNAIDYAAGEWLLGKLGKLGSQASMSEVTLHTQDGWTLYGNLSLPDGIRGDRSVPGVILLPAALADRDSYYSLERLLASNDIAVLNLEWRGTGKSTDKGFIADLPFSEVNRAALDALEGYRFLASQKGVDPERIGILGAVFAALLAMYAAKENSKLKAIVMLSPFIWPWKWQGDCETINNINQPVLLITGDGVGDTTKEFAELVKKNERNAVLTYPGAIAGSSLFHADKQLETTIARWFKQQLVEAVS